MSNDIIQTEGTQFSLQSLSEELQKKILAASERLSKTSMVNVKRIRNDAKNFIMPDGTEAQEFSGIIIGVKHANVHYAGEYEEGVSNPPDCFAIIEGVDDASCEDLIPHGDVAAPYATNCGACTKLQWGSAGDGKKKGKACGEHTLLAVAIPALTDDIYLVEAKKGNSKIADGYIATTTARYGHPIAVLTKFMMGNDKKWTQGFEVAGQVSPDLIKALADRMDEGNAMLYERVYSAYKRNSNEPVADKAVVEEVSRKARARSNG